MVINLLFPIIHFLIFDVSSVQSLLIIVMLMKLYSHLDQPKITEGAWIFKHHV